MADNEGRHGALVWAGKRIAGRKVGRSWRPESFLNENKAVLERQEMRQYLIR